MVNLSLIIESIPLQFSILIAPYLMSKNKLEPTHKKSRSQLIKDMMTTESNFDEDFDDIFPPVFPLDFSSNMESTSNNLLLPVSVNESNDQYSLSLSPTVRPHQVDYQQETKSILLEGTGNGPALLSENQIHYQPLVRQIDSFSSALETNLKNEISRHTPSEISHQEHQSSLIGSSNERAELHSEIARSFEASLMNDIAVERKKTLKKAEENKTEERQQKALKLQEKRKLRVQTESNNLEKTVNLAVCHPELRTHRRQFREDSTMNSVYDWIGSLSPEPMYFGLFPKLHSDPVLPSADVKLYDKTVLNVGILTDPIDFEEDQEMTMHGYSNTSNMEILENQT